MYSCPYLLCGLQDATTDHRTASDVMKLEFDHTLYLPLPYQLHKSMKAKHQTLCIIVYLAWPALFQDLFRVWGAQGFPPRSFPLPRISKVVSSTTVLEHVWFPPPEEPAVDNPVLIPALLARVSHTRLIVCSFYLGIVNEGPSLAVWRKFTSCRISQTLYDSLQMR